MDLFFFQVVISSDGVERAEDPSGPLLVVTRYGWAGARFRRVVSAPSAIPLGTYSAGSLRLLYAALGLADAPTPNMAPHYPPNPFT